VDSLFQRISFPTTTTIMNLVNLVNSLNVGWWKWMEWMEQKRNSIKLFWVIKWTDFIYARSSFSRMPPRNKNDTRANSKEFFIFFLFYDFHFHFSFHFFFISASSPLIFVHLILIFRLIDSNFHIYKVACDWLDSITNAYFLLILLLTNYKLVSI
jgi:hypothetical protein